MFSSQIQKHVLCLSIYFFLFCYWRLLCAIQVEMKQTIEQNKKSFHMVCGYQKNCNDTAAEWHVLNIIQNHRAILN